MRWIQVCVIPMTYLSHTTLSFSTCFFSLFFTPSLDCCLLDLSMGYLCMGLGASEEKGEMAIEQTSHYSALRPLCIIPSYSPAALGPPPPCPVKSNPYSTCTVSEKRLGTCCIPLWELGSRNTETIESVLLQWRRHGLGEPRSEVTPAWGAFL